MVDDLLDLAKVDAGRISISPEWFEMVDLFSALRGMFKPIVGSGTVSLIFEETNAIPRIYTDDKKLSQILRNFISNALKFTKEGEVRVSATLVGDGRVEFAVSDTGIGIAKEHLPALFSDFVQIDTRIQKRLRGTGLGLSLAKKFAELLGELSRCHQRRGARIALLRGNSDSLFRKREIGLPCERRYHNQKPTGKILAVDDNPAALYATSRVLRSAGYEVMEATTGSGALALGATGRPGCLGHQFARYGWL